MVFEKFVSLENFVDQLTLEEVNAVVELIEKKKKNYQKGCELIQELNEMLNTIENEGFGSIKIENSDDIFINRFYYDVKTNMIHAGTNF